MLGLRTRTGHALRSLVRGKQPGVYVLQYARCCSNQTNLRVPRAQLSVRDMSTWLGERSTFTRCALRAEGGSG